MRKTTMTESATLDFPPIVEPPQAPAPAPTATAIAVAPKSVVTIKEAAVAHLRAHEPTILALAERYRGVALPLDTPKGLAAGQAALTEVRENGRFAVQRARDATKDLLNGAKKDVELEAARLIALIQPTEEHIEAQVTARKAVLAAEKAERERIEAERVAKHQTGINIIRSYITQAQGKTSEQLARVLPTIEAIDCTTARFEEFSDEACKALGDVLLALRDLHDTTKAREEEAARLEAQRVEQARIAAEQAEAQRKLDEQAAELKRRQDELDRAEREAQAQRDAQAEAARIAALPPAVKQMVESEGEPVPTEALPIVAAQAMNHPEAIEQPVTPHDKTPAWPIRGVHVDGDHVIGSVKGGNDAARWLCGELVALIDGKHVEAQAVDEIMALADSFGAAVVACCHNMHVDKVAARIQEYAALRTAVEFLVAERDALRAAHELIATLDHTRPLLDARAISRAALKGNR